MTPKSFTATFICQKCASSGPKVAPKWVCSDSCWSFGGGKGHKIGPKRVLGPSQGVQGGTEEAPGRHQGGTKEAPRSTQPIDQAPQEPPHSKKELFTIRSVLI